MILDLAEKANALLEEIIALTENGAIKWDYTKEIYEGSGEAYKGYYGWPDHKGCHTRLILTKDLLNIEATQMNETLDISTIPLFCTEKRAKLIEKLKKLVITKAKK